MTAVQDKIRQRLAVLAPVSLDIIDDSAKHAGHAGARSGGGHYRLAIISPRFSGLNTLARHRLIYATLSDLMHSEIHALAIDVAEAPSNH
ncbi:MAG: BolA family transcriptional regulator [Zoogloeaceae bacterium]|nr:BolA family transcriptional regulator [Zoogloeaceae bacterium]